MCTAVVISAQRIERVFWSRDDLAVVIPPNTTLTAALPEIRAILHDLGAPKTGELTCWCGEAIELPRALLEEALSGTPTHEQPTSTPK